MESRNPAFQALSRAGGRAGLWVMQTRPLFLIGSVALALLGTALAWWDGFFNLNHAVLAFAGLLLWHISVNVLNDYFDYRSGIDLETTRTPFSGGSGLLPAKVLRAEPVKRAGLVVFALAIPIWVYLAVESGPLLLLPAAVAAACVLFYTPFLVRIGLGELASAYGVGIFPILAFYFVQTGSFTLQSAVVAVTAAIFVFNLHLLNEFPDIEPDRSGGRKTLAILMGRRRASRLYLFGSLAAYGWIAAWVAAGEMPLLASLCFLTLPVTGYAAAGLFRYDGGAGSPTLWAGAIAYTTSIVVLAAAYLVSGPG